MLQETSELAAKYIVELVTLVELIVIVGAVRSNDVNVIVVEPEYVPMDVPDHVRPNVKDSLIVIVLVPSDEWLTVCVPLVIVFEPEPPMVVVPECAVPLIVIVYDFDELEVTDVGLYSTRL